MPREVAFPRKTMLCHRRLPPNSLLCIAPCRQREAASLKGVQQRAKQRRTLSSLAPSARRRRPGTKIWGRVILGAVIAVLVATWLAAIWLSFADPQWLLQKWR